jgi:hypothetical protein
MHISSSYASYGMYSAEARSRMLYLNPGTNYTPWLFLDGSSMGSGYSGWGTMITSRASQGSPITARIWGDYNVSTRNGTIYVSFKSDSATTLQGNVLFIITEDSIQRSTPNGDLWHNHVARDYIPDHIGTPVTLRYQDSVTVTYPFNISSAWVDTKCEIVAMIQDPVAVGITKEIWQGAKIRLYDLNLSGIEENNETPRVSYKVNVAPNPCVNQARFAFTLPNNTEYRISIFDISGREIKTLNGIASGKNEFVTCNLVNEVNSGVYFYRFESNTANTSGKIIVK